jgi:hypothetical protein
MEIYAKKFKKSTLKRHSSSWYCLQEDQIEQLVLKQKMARSSSLSVMVTLDAGAEFRNHFFLVGPSNQIHSDIDASAAAI